MQSTIATKFNATVIVTSDTCYDSPEKDTSGKYVVDELYDLNFIKVNKHIVPDVGKLITESVRLALADPNNALVITVGGTGLCPRDVTPEATSILYDKPCNGISAALLMGSLRYSPAAALSRLTAGIAGKCLIVNFPGKLKACRECFSLLQGFLSHALEQIRFDSEAIESTHLEQERALIAPSIQPTKHTNNYVADAQKLVYERQGEEVIASTMRSLGLARTDEELTAPELTSHENSQEERKKLVAPPLLNQPLSPTKATIVRPTVYKYNISLPLSFKSTAQVSFSTPLNLKNPMLTPEASPENQIKQRFGVLERNSTVMVEDKAEEAQINGGPLIRPNFPLFDSGSGSISSSNVGTNCSSSGNSRDSSNIDGLNLSEPKAVESPYPLINYKDALRIMSSISSKPAQSMVSDLSLNSFEAAHQALGTVLAADVKSEALIPPFSVSTMDGYVLNIPLAMRSFMLLVKSLPASIVSNLEQFRKMQDDPSQVSKFFCYQVNTGCQVPEKNFAVVPFEKTKLESNSVTILGVELDKFVRKPGSDLNQNDCIKAGTVLGPVELSIILSMGHRRIKVFKKPKLGILSTGDELIEFFNSNLREDSGKVIDTNGPLLASLFKLNDHEVANCGISRDEPQEVLMKIKSNLRECDILVITGGASMGTKDFVKDAIKQLGGVIHFGRLNIKPGKPVALASIMIEGRQKFIFSLPGNPVSAYVTAIVLVLPFTEHVLRNHSGINSTLTFDQILSTSNLTVEVDTILDSEDNGTYEFDGRLEFVRAKLLKPKDGVGDGETKRTFLVSVSIKQQSSRMLSLKDCDCLVVIDPSLKGSKLSIGQTFPALRLNSLLKANQII